MGLVERPGDPNFVTSRDAGSGLVAARRSPAGRHAHQVHHEVSEDGQVLSGVARTDAAWVLVERPVEHPVQPVLDAPVLADDAGDRAGGRLRVGDDEVRLLHGRGTGPLVVALPLDPRDAVQAGPFVALVDPAEVPGERARPRLDAPVAGVHLLVRLYDRSRIVDRTLRPSRVREEPLDVFVQGRVVVLHGQHVVGFLLHDLRRDRALTAHRVDGDRDTSDVEEPQQLRDGDDLVRLLGHLHLSQHQALVGEPCAHPVDRLAPRRRVEAAAQRLAVDGDMAVLPHGAEPVDPVAEQRLHDVRVE